MIKDDTRPLVWLLGTGGTIAQWADSRLAFVEYGTDKHIDVHGNLERIPEIQEFVRTEAEHLWNVGSDQHNGVAPFIQTRQRDLVKP